MEFGKKVLVRFAALALGMSFTLVGCDEEEMEAEDMEELDDGGGDGKSDGLGFYVCTPQMLMTFQPCGSLLREVVVFILSGGEAEALNEFLVNIAGGGDLQECIERGAQWAECHEHNYGNHGISCSHAKFSDGVVGNAVVQCSNGTGWNAAHDEFWNCNDEDYGTFCQNQPGGQ